MYFYRTLVARCLGASGPVVGSCLQCRKHERIDRLMTHHNAFELAKNWKEDERWKGITRPYTAEDVMRLRGSIHIEHTLARLGAQRLWELLHNEPYIAALGAL